MIIVLLLPPPPCAGDKGIGCGRRALTSAGLGCFAGSAAAGDGAGLTDGSPALPTLAPHPLQKFFPGSICVPHRVQNIQTPSHTKIVLARDLRGTVAISARAVN
jgi:hypothetical protein